MFLLSIKRGTGQYPIEAYKSRAVCTLGSGDVFGGALVANYLRTNCLRDSVDIASCIASAFVEQTDTEGILSTEAIKYVMKEKPKWHVPNIRGKSIYLAGPFFSRQELNWVNSVCSALEDAGFQVYSPSRENGIIDSETPLQKREEIFLADLNFLKKADTVVALLDHNDTGTHFEAGFAFESGIPIFGLHTSSEQLNNMLRYGCYSISHSVEKLIEALYDYHRK